MERLAVVLAAVAGRLGVLAVVAGLVGAGTFTLGREVAVGLGLAAVFVVVGTGKDAAPVVEIVEAEGDGITSGVTAAVDSDGGATGNKRFQVSAPTIPSGAKPAAC